MVLRTILPVKKSSWEISHEDFIFSIGSCFADCLAERLISHQFKVIDNPFGILYNPLAIVSNLLKKKALKEEYVVKNNRYFHYDFHSEISGESKEELTEKIGFALNETTSWLAKTNYLVITLGTAFVYYLKEKNISVANCHKMPSDIFFKKMLSPEEIVQSFDQLIKYLNKINPAIKILLTVSPVRHLKDSLELNSVSKSILRLTTWQLTEKYPDKIAYFPSSEIMLDELREYRFYKEDMIHITSQAESYIWQHFSETFFSKNTIELNKEISELVAALSHRPFQPQSDDHLKFLLNTQEKAIKLNDKVAVKDLLQKLALKLE